MNNIIIENGNLQFNGKIYQCAIGKAGLAADKKEGDNCTPLGEYLLRKVLYRADKVAKPLTKLPAKVIVENDGWCDAPDDKNYNLQIKLPYPANHEKLWREDDIYDVIVPLGYNDVPVIPGKGSAIFLHVARPGYEGTEGCVALALPDLLEVLSQVNSDTKIIISR